MEGRDRDRQRAFEEGAAAQAGVALDHGAFGRGWERMEARRRGRGDGAAAAAGDVFLAIACDEGAPGAWETLEREYAPRLRGLLRKRGATEAEAADMLSDLPGYLCQPPEDGRARTRIGTYDGTGSLFSWLAVVALRGVNQRRQRASAAVQRDGSVSSIATLRAMPAGAAMAEEAAVRFQAALAAGWASLTHRERLAVLLRHRDGLAGREIARLMGVGEPRVSRLLEAGLSRLRDAVRRQMAGAGASTPETTVWNALGDVLAKHLASLASASHHVGEASDA